MITCTMPCKRHASAKAEKYGSMKIDGWPVHAASTGNE